MNKKVLCVDDDKNILESYKRQLRGHVELSTACGGEEGLKTAAAQGPFAVVVSDLMMPGMDGIHLLAKMRDRFPETVRMMLTGQADLNKAIEAVNEGSIFRFMTKPCASASLIRALQAGVEQYRLVTAEKELLEKTLSGSIKVLMEVLSLVSPAAFGRAVRIQRIMRKLSVKLGVESKWAFDLAGMLSQIGCVTVPTPILQKKFIGEDLSEQEADMYGTHPGIGHDLIVNIPRLEPIAKIIEYQEKDYNGSGFPEDDIRGLDIPLGARALHIVLDFETQLSSGKNNKGSLERLSQYRGKYDPVIMKALKAIYQEELFYKSQPISLEELEPKMILAEDVLSISGLLLIANGQEATRPLIARLKNFQKTMGVKEPIFIQTDDKESIDVDEN